MSDTTLQDLCLRLCEAASSGEKWLADNSATVSNAETIRKRLRRSGRQLQSYARAAGNKMGVAVFGPSQAGKSTLISALAKGPGGSLKARLGDQVLDFMLQINPEGGNETTGLVTRFSLEPPPPSPDAGHPVCVKLFSEMDIVKILTNTYFGEAKGSCRISDEELTQGLDELSSKPAAQNHLNIDDLEDLAEYVKNVSIIYSSGEALEKSYWPRAISLAPKLALPDRAELFSYLWGKVPEFTEVYKNLHNALEKLNFEEIAYCEISALYDEEHGRSKSVLHVDRLMGILDATGETVSVVNTSGTQSGLFRPVLSALIAEMHVQILEKPGEFMNNADILDFPGYRAREKLVDIVEEIKNPEILKKCFLRGKVAYLFERYCAKKEITSMLLCIAESVQNNPDLPGVIDQWLRDTHGQNATERTGKPVSLFLVLTKFDRLLEQGAGSTDCITRWENRYNASFLQFFGNYNWATEWSLQNGKPVPFKNLFWLLNLGFGKSFLDIEEIDAAQELYRARGVLPERADWVSKVCDGYLKTEATINHIAEPEAAWKAVVEGEDGGVAYITSKLTPILSSDLKTRQLTDLAMAEVSVINGSLRDFYQGGDKDEERTIKEALAGKILMVFKSLALEKHRFGHLLRRMQLSDDECRSFYNAPLPEDEAPAVDSAVLEETPPPPPVIDMNDLLGLGPDLNSTPREGAKTSNPLLTKSNDAAGRYRRRLELAWLTRLDELASDPRWQRYFSFPRDLYLNLVDELGQGARRLGIFNQIENILREAISYGNVNPERLIWKQARLASTILNSYINWLGLSPRQLDSQARTVSIRGHDVLLFETPEAPDDFLQLPETQANFDLPYFQDWARAFFRLVIHNVDFAEKTYDPEENLRLGSILRIVDSTSEALQ